MSLSGLLFVIHMCALSAQQVRPGAVVHFVLLVALHVSRFQVQLQLLLRQAVPYADALQLLLLRQQLLFLPLQRNVPLLTVNEVLQVGELRV